MIQHFNNLEQCKYCGVILASASGRTESEPCSECFLVELAIEMFE